MKTLRNARIAVVGATGNVGRTMLSILEERGIPKDHIFAVASARSAGQSISYGEKVVLPVHALETFNFSQCQVALFSPGGAVSAEFAPLAAQHCVVIDNTSHFRMDPDIPLVIPEINGHHIARYSKRRIIANPNCSTIQLLMALAPLHHVAPIKRVVVSTYQSVSGAGKEGMDELFDQSRGVFMNTPRAPQRFTKPIAFNVIPQCDAFLEDGTNKEEWKMACETKKILDPAIELTATCVRVPVFIGHSVAANIEFSKNLTAKDARHILSKAKGIQVMDDPDNDVYTTPVECAGEDAVFVSRIRQDPTVENGLWLWVVADNIRKGAALNAVQIAEILVKEYL
jgi:aspartate-semialdehyde dehydrogenase